MSDVVPDFIGNGRGTECEEFVKAVTQHMFDDDTDEDDRYVARFAATRLSGGALRWYATELEEDTRKSWILLRKALFERYPNDDESTVPTPAAAPKSVSSDTGSQANDDAASDADEEEETPTPAVSQPPISTNGRGHIQITILSGPMKDQVFYVAWTTEPEGQLQLTQSTASALVVGYTTSHSLYLKNYPVRKRWLGVTWNAETSKPDAYGILTSAWSATTDAALDGPTSSNCWQVESNGEILTYWTNANSLWNRRPLSPRMTPTGLIFVLNGDVDPIPAVQVPVRLTLVEDGF